MADNPKASETQPLPRAQQPVHSKIRGIASFVMSFWLIAETVWLMFYSDVPNSSLKYYLSFFFVLSAYGFFHLGRRILAPSADDVLAHDKRAPVVYLRPFAEDDRVIYRLPVGKRVGGKSVNNPWWKASHEQWLAHALKVIGPVVAVGKPGDKLAPFGAARFYLADDEWQQKVDALLRSAAVVVLRPETSAGTRWEVGEVSQLIDHRRVLLIVPNPSNRPLAFARVKSLMDKAWPLPSELTNADAFIFDEQGNPQPLTWDNNAAAALGAFVDQIQKLQGAAPPGHNRQSSRAWLSSGVRSTLNALHGAPQTEPAPLGAPSGEFPDVPFRLQNRRLSCAAGTQPLEHLVWVYAETYTERVFKHYQLVVWNRDGVACVLPVREMYCQTALDLLRRAAPWLPVGYSQAVKESWNADRADLLALIDSHRAGGTAFDASWAGSDVVVVKPEVRLSWLR